MSGEQNQPEVRIRRWWNEEEDRILREAVAAQAIGNNVLNDWNSIALKLPGRSNKDCRKRWAKICTDVKKGAWDAEEDKRLCAAVQRHGFCWTEVAQEVQTRHADQCAKRWQHSLNPSVLHSKWEPEDDDKLMRAVEEFGRSWSRISDERFPTRSPTDIKNRHALILRRHQSEWRKTCELGMKITMEEAMETDDFSDANSNEWASGNEPLNVTSQPASKKQMRESDNHLAMPVHHDWANLAKGSDGLPGTNPLEAHNMSLAWDPMELPSFVSPTNIFPTADPLTNPEHLTTFLPGGPFKTEPPKSTPTSLYNSNPPTFNHQTSSSGSTITLVIQNLKPHTLGAILDTLYRDGAEYKLDVQR